MDLLYDEQDILNHRLHDLNEAHAATQVLTSLELSTTQCSKRNAIFKA